MKRSLDVEGIVDSQTYDNNMDARSHGRWSSLSHWLKDNDGIIREKFDTQERRMVALQAEI